MRLFPGVLFRQGVSEMRMAGNGGGGMGPEGEKKSGGLAATGHGEVRAPDGRLGEMAAKAVGGAVLLLAGVLMFHALVRGWPEIQAKVGWFVLPILSAGCGGAGIWLIVAGVGAGLKRMGYWADEEHFYREERWWMFKRRTAWRRESISHVSREWKKTSQGKTFSGGAKLGMDTDWYEVVLTLDDGRGVKLAKACGEEESKRFYEAMRGLLKEPSGKWWKWGVPPGRSSVTVKEEAERVEVTFGVVPAWKFGSEYWLGLEFMSAPVAIGMILAIGMLATRGGVVTFVAGFGPRAVVVCLAIAIVLGLAVIGGGIVKVARKRAATVTMITCGKETLTVSRTYKEKSELMRFSAREIEVISRERFEDPALRREALTVNVIRRRELEPRLALVCEKCGYDLRHEPETCPECGIKIGPVKVREAMPIGIVKCRTPLEASWLEARLNQWLEGVRE